jgi:hypothetical protein
MLMKLRAYTEAIPIFERAMSINPLLAEGSLGESLNLCKQAVRLAVSRPNFMLSSGAGSSELFTPSTTGALEFSRYFPANDDPGVVNYPAPPFGAHTRMGYAGERRTFTADEIISAGSVGSLHDMPPPRRPPVSRLTRRLLPETYNEMLEITASNRNFSSQSLALSYTDNSKEYKRGSKSSNSTI